MELRSNSIVFSGKLSEENIRRLERFDGKRTILLLVVLIASMIVLALSVSMLTIEQSTVMTVIYIVLTVISGSIVSYGLIICLLYWFIGSLDIPFFKACYFDNQTVVVDEWGIYIRIDFDPANKFDMLQQGYSANSSDIKKVYETDDFYIIIAGRFYKKGFICQKNLLTSGTLEEFESLFDGKMVQID